MPMTNPITSTPSASNSPPSEESNIPLSPTMSQPDQAQQAISKSPSPSQQGQQQQSNINNTAPTGVASSQAKRKPSRRANTAERRATHNAVERQRRETLNGRFLDLAALLPNLSQIRRPSKSSIVNSSIAHIHASRRHRMHAARELRLLKNEADALRGELNEWRDRAGIPRIEEPIRSEAFAMVMSAELEVIAAVGEEDEEDMGYGGYDGEDDGYVPSGHVMPPVPGMPHTGLDDLEDPRMPMLKVSSYGVPVHPVHARHGSGNALHLAHIIPRPAAQGVGPMMASPADISFDNRTVPTIFDSPAYSGAPFIAPQQSHSIHSLESEKIAAWNAAQMYHSNGQMMPQPRSMFSPPASHPVSTGSPGHSSHSSNGSVSPGPHMSSSPVSSHSGVPFNEAEFYQGLGDRDIDKPLVAPAISSMRNRSGSLNINMGMTSPGGSPTYDLGNSHGDYGLNMPRSSGVWTRDGDIAISGLNVGMGIGVGVGMNAVAVGGGGNGTGFSMMM
ncbi:hypothetical protein APHAL10511_008552 [Amanita phalloides]|nr:hypothetical protein APHAL10511_008552 [Amanita phalloides]